MNDNIAHYDQLMQRYVAVCNTAMLRNAERFPFKQILQAAEQSALGKFVEVNIHDHEDQTKFVLMIKDGRIQSLPHDDCEKCDCTSKWAVQSSYLQEVVEDADLYIENPAKIDWDWLYV